MKTNKPRYYFSPIGILLAILVVCSNCAAQQAARRADSGTIHALSVNYNHIIFDDDFSSDSVRDFPAKWMLSRAGDDDKGRKAIAHIRTWKSEKVLKIFPARYAYPLPAVANKPISLPDSFNIEFDFIMESRTFAVDTVDSYALKHPVMRTIHSTTGIAPAHYPVYVDTNRKYPVARFSSAFHYGEWNHCIMNYTPRHLTCYIVNDHPFVSFTDSIFNFYQLAMGLGTPLLIKRFRIFTAVPKKGTYTSARFDALKTTKKLVTRAIKFDVNKAVIKNGNATFLNELASWLNEHTDVYLEIDGHTDNDGDAAENKLLSLRRSEAIKKWLVVAGVDGKRLTTKGYGATKPMDTNTTPEGKAINRRVEFVVVTQQQTTGM